MDKDSKFTRDDEGYIAVRVVNGTEALPAIDKDYLFGRDENGNIAMRVVGAGGGGGGSVNYNRVVEKATVIPDASTQPVGKVYMYMGETNSTYTHGYIYENLPQMTDSSATISQTSGVVPATATFTIMSGNVSISADPEDVESFYLKYFSTGVSDTISIAYNPDTAQINVSSAYYGVGHWTTQAEMEAAGFVFSGPFGAGCQVNCDFVPSKRLQNLSVDVKTFETAEQPTGNETVNFVAGKTTLSVLSGTNGGMTVTIDPDVLVSRFPELIAGISSGQIYKIGVNGVYLENSGWDNNLQAQLLIYSSPDTLGMTINLDTDTNRDYYGITISGVGAEQNVEYTIISNSLVEIPWSKNGTTVDISEYGISYSGTPKENDTLTVAYLAPSVTGYGWEQLNVQPAPKEGIDWKVKLDLPAEYTGDLWNAIPVYTIAGGLPNGKYKFYFSTKQTSDFAQTNELYAEAVFTVLFNIQNSTTEFQGVMGYVFDGEYIPSPNFARALDQIDLYSFIGTKGNDTVIATISEPFSSGVLGPSGMAKLVPECFKISAITNVETGEEYIPTGYVPLDGQIPADFYAYSGRLTLARLGNPPYVPSKSIFTTLSYSEINNNFGFRIQTGQANKIYIRCSSGDDVFYANVYRTTNEYEQEILQATGKFENWKFRFESAINTSIDIDFGTPDFTSDVSVAAGAFGSEPSSGFYISDVVNQAELASLVCPYVGIGKSCRMETPTANQLGGVVQYVGETNANYTKGSSYTAKGTVVITPESAVAENIDPNVATISIDASALVTAISTYTGWQKSEIRQELNGGHSWQIGYDFDNNQIINLFWSRWGSFDSSVWSAFTVTPDSGQSGVQYINFVTQYTPESKEVQNGYWELLQPGSSLPDQTGNAGKFLTTDGTDASWGTTIQDRLNITLNSANAEFMRIANQGQIVMQLQQFSTGSIPQFVFYWQSSSSQQRAIAFQGTSVWPNQNDETLGKDTHKWDNVYTTKINNGADIAVPATGGTMVVATPPTTDGTYVLKATVSSGTVTYAWVAE